MKRMFVLMIVMMVGCHSGLNIQEKKQEVTILGLDTGTSRGQIREVNVGGCIVAFAGAWQEEFGGSYVSLRNLYAFATRSGLVEREEVGFQAFSASIRYFANQQVNGYDIQSNGSSLFRVISSN